MASTAGYRPIPVFEHGCALDRANLGSLWNAGKARSRRGSRLPRHLLNMDRMAQRSEAGFKKTLALCRVRMNCSGDVFEPRTHFER
jgi:hypothetical protein